MVQINRKPSYNSIRNKDGGVVDIIHTHFDEFGGYPVQKHEDDFRLATELLLKNAKKPSDEKLQEAQLIITKSVLRVYPEDHAARPSWNKAEKKAKTIISQLSEVIQATASYGKKK